MAGNHSFHLDVWAAPVGLNQQHAMLDLIPPSHAQHIAIRSLIRGLPLSTLHLIKAQHANEKNQLVAQDQNLVT